MYKTTRNIAGDTSMICKDCGHEISMNKICEKPIQAATDTLKHVPADNASRAFATIEREMRQEPAPLRELCPVLSVSQQQLIASISQSFN